MIVDTHLLISQILYKYISKQMDFKLNRLSFTYGNIKPDFINKDIKSSHTLEESLDSLSKYSDELMSQDISIKEFSRSLGITCHFICDYFCLYHREGNEKKGLLEHLFYESILHVKIISLLLKGKIVLSNNEMSENNVEDLVLALQKKYNLESQCVTRDINNALLAASQISKLIVCSSQLYFEQKEIDIPQQYHLS